MIDAASLRDLPITVATGLGSIRLHIPELQRHAGTWGQPGAMHGLELLLGSRFYRRKQPYLLRFHTPADRSGDPPKLMGAVLLVEYRILGLGTGLFATADAFGVRTVAAPAELHAPLCALAGRFLLDGGALLVLTTWRLAAGDTEPELQLTESGSASSRLRYALSTRIVQDTLPLQQTAEGTLQTLGKRTRVHMRSARRRFDREYPDAQLLDASASLSRSSDATLKQLNASSLDVIDQDEFNHQVRSVCDLPGGFVLGLSLRDRWIALAGGWRQDNATWIEWQCNGRGFEKLSLGSVLRTYLLEEEAKRETTRLGFHGGTSHSMLHRFQPTAVADLLMRRDGLFSSMAVWLVLRLCHIWPRLLKRGNFLWNALCTPGLRWSSYPPTAASTLPFPPQR